MRILAWVAALLAAPAALAQSVLLDASEITTAPGAAVDGADLSEMQRDLGATVTGYSADLGAATRVAEDFVVPTGGWTVQGIDLYAFQPGATVSALGVSGVNVRIWTGVPEAPGSVVVFGDAATNRATQIAFGGDYRVSGKRGSVARPVARVRVNVSNLGLEAGSYWIDYQFTGALTAGPFVPPRVIPTAEANARQRRGGAWSAVVDRDQAIALPLRVLGSVGGAGTSPDLLFRDGFE